MVWDIVGGRGGGRASIGAEDENVVTRRDRVRNDVSEVEHLAAGTFVSVNEIRDGTSMPHFTRNFLVAC